MPLLTHTHSGHGAANHLCLLVFIFWQRVKFAFTPFVIFLISSRCLIFWFVKNKFL